MKEEIGKCSNCGETTLVYTSKVFEHIKYCQECLNKMQVSKHEF